MFSKMLNHLDFNKNEARNMVLSVSASAPASPVAGQCYYDSALTAARWYDGAAWTNKATDSLLLNGQNAAFYLARGNHTGTQVSATISDLATTVQSYRLDQFAAPTTTVSMGNQRIINQADPVGAQDSATKNYVDTQLTNAAAGIDSKTSVRIALTANDTLSGLAVRDGVTPVAGDRVLATAQTTASQNGVYVAAAGAWMRGLDADATGEITPGAFWYVEEGTSFGATQWRCSNTGTITLGTTGIAIAQFGSSINYTASLGVQKVGNDFRAQVVASGGIAAVAGGMQIDTTVVARRFAATVGTGASATATVTHNLGTQDVIVSVRDATTNEFVGIKVVSTDANTVTLTAAANIAANSLRIMVTG